MENQVQPGSSNTRLLCCCLCLSFFLFFAVLLAGLIVVKFVVFPTKPPVRIIAYPKEWQLMEANNASVRLTFEEAQKYCGRLNKTLVTPIDQIQEDALINWIIEHDDVVGVCRSFFLGYRADGNNRYTSLDGVKSWPSLDHSFEAAIPFDNRTCVYITDDLQITNQTSCSVISEKCFLCAYVKDGCNVDRYSKLCYGRLKIKTNETSALKSVDKCKELFPTTSTNYGLMVVDYKHIPINRISILQGYSKKCRRGVIGIAVAAKYNLDYESVVDKSKMTYTSNRMMITEPNYDCLAIDKSYNYRVITESCMKPSCAICVHNVKK